MNYFDTRRDELEKQKESLQKNIDDIDRELQTIDETEQKMSVKSSFEMDGEPVDTNAKSKPTFGEAFKSFAGGYKDAFLEQSGWGDVFDLWDKW